MASKVKAAIRIRQQSHEWRNNHVRQHGALDPTKLYPNDFGWNELRAQLERYYKDQPQQKDPWREWDWCNYYITHDEASYWCSPEGQKQLLERRRQKKCCGNDTWFCYQTICEP